MEARYGTGAINRAIYHTETERGREGRETGTDHYMKTVGEEAKPRTHSPYKRFKGKKKKEDA